MTCREPHARDRGRGRARPAAGRRHATRAPSRASCSSRPPTVRRPVGVPIDGRDTVNFFADGTATVLRGRPRRPGLEPAHDHHGPERCHDLGGRPGPRRHAAGVPRRDLLDPLAPDALRSPDQQRARSDERLQHAEGRRPRGRRPSACCMLPVLHEARTTPWSGAAHAGREPGPAARRSPPEERLAAGPGATITRSGPRCSPRWPAATATRTSSRCRPSR